jgi:hypothetical protein
MKLVRNNIHLRDFLSLVKSRRKGGQGRDYDGVPPCFLGDCSISYHRYYLAILLVNPKAENSFALFVSGFD